VKATWLRAAFALALMLLVPAACDNDPAGLIDVLDITNRTDRYEFALDNPGTYSGTTRHQWSFTGTVAQLVIESAASGGSGSITIQDADNGQVIVQSVLEAGTFDSQAGRAGTWIVTTILVNVTGELSFRITKK
jgi:hypothetical protein